MKIKTYQKTSKKPHRNKKQFLAFFAPSLNFVKIPNVGNFYST